MKGNQCALDRNIIRTFKFEPNFHWSMTFHNSHENPKTGVWDLFKVSKEKPGNKPTFISIMEPFKTILKTYHSRESFSGFRVINKYNKHYFKLEYKKVVLLLTICGKKSPLQHNDIISCNTSYCVLLKLKTNIYPFIPYWITTTSY